MIREQQSVSDTTVEMRAAIPGVLKSVAAMLLGLTCVTYCSNCGVSNFTEREMLVFL